jgi:UDP-N-acetylmuramoyl-tripeptide--D-alanyl-D-alanine ligase
VGTEHSTSIGTLEDVAREKRRLLDGLRPGGLAVLSADDPRVRAMAGGPATRAVRFGFSADADVRAEALRIDWPHGTRFELVVPEGRFDAFVRPLGRPAVTAALAAVAVARELGVPVETALARLAQGFAPAPGRLEPVALPGGAWALRDDFKAQLEPIETALDLLAAIPARRRLLVLGPITEPPRPIRTTYRRLGERLAPVVDRLIGCGPFRGRFEELAAAARRAGLAAAAISFEPTVAGAAETLRGELGPGDVVLLKGQKNVRLERIVLALGGRRVGCDLVRCFVKTVPCTSCPMLEPGWEGRRAVT